MRYNVILASRAICRKDMMKGLSFIPNTEKEIIMDTESGIGQEIWFGYLQMREAQKAHQLPDDCWHKVHVPEDSNPENEIHKFREAINIFFRFSAGEGRDNCLAVKEISMVA